MSPRAVGLDVVEIARVRRAVERTPAFARRVLGEGERRAWTDAGYALVDAVAVCFAVKEAVIKALGARPPGFRWDAVVVDPPVALDDVPEDARSAAGELARVGAVIGASVRADRSLWWVAALDATHVVAIAGG